MKLDFGRALIWVGRKRDQPLTYDDLVDAETRALEAEERLAQIATLVAGATQVGAYNHRLDANLEAIRDLAGPVGNGPFPSELNPEYLEGRDAIVERDVAEMACRRADAELDRLRVHLNAGCSALADFDDHGDYEAPIEVLRQLVALDQQGGDAVARPVRLATEENTVMTQRGAGESGSPLKPAECDPRKLSKMLWPFADHLATELPSPEGYYLAWADRIREAALLLSTCRCRTQPSPESGSEGGNGEKPVRTHWLATHGDESWSLQIVPDAEGGRRTISVEGHYSAEGDDDDFYAWPSPKQAREIAQALVVRADEVERSEQAVPAPSKGPEVERRAVLEKFIGWDGTEVWRTLQVDPSPIWLAPPFTEVMPVADHQAQVEKLERERDELHSDNVCEEEIRLEARHAIETVERRAEDAEHRASKAEAMIEEAVKEFVSRMERALDLGEVRATADIWQSAAFYLDTLLPSGEGERGS